MKKNLLPLALIAIGAMSTRIDGDATPFVVLLMLSVPMFLRARR
jgi:hypothetical protein